MNFESPHGGGGQKQKTHYVRGVGTSKNKVSTTIQFGKEVEEFSDKEIAKIEESVLEESDNDDINGTGLYFYSDSDALRTKV